MKINMDTILIDPHPLLRTKASPVKTPLSNEDKKTIMAMRKYVHDSKIEEIAEAERLKPAVGIAAPQIGISKQLLAIEIEHSDADGNISYTELALANPKIIAHSPFYSALANGEGCLSVLEEKPGYVHRYLRIRVAAYDCIQKKDVEIKASGYLAIVLQHEIDHLNGILFYDHIDQENPWLAKENTSIIE